MKPWGQKAKPALGLLVGIVVGIAWLAAAPSSGARQGTPVPDVMAEAVGQANLRSGPGIEYPVVGEIAAGTRYGVLAYHTQVPWLRLDFPGAAGEAWVYQDLVTVYGSLSLVPAVNTFNPLHTATPQLSDEPLTPTVTLAAFETLPAATEPPSDLPTLTPTLFGPIATTLGEANIRFGPGTEYPSIIKVGAGMSYRVLELHALYPWVHVALDASPTGTGWIFRDVVQITGDLSNTPTTSTTQFRYPTLTATPQTVVVNGVPWKNSSAAPGTLAKTLGQAMHSYLLSQEFAPYSEHLASVFVMDLQNGDTFTINDGVAFSGMSVTKIAILAAYFQRHQGPLSVDDAYIIADTMMCSENITTNKLLAYIGDGDALRGAQRVTAFLQSLGLLNTFIMREYVTNPDEPPVGVGTIRTGADQVSARPDTYNQVVPKELGWLLAGIYQCAQNETGLLMERYPADFDAQECRQMLYAMDANTINVFIEAGVPAGTRVIHKHGWVDETHGDAGIVIGPHGAYVLVAALYSPDWLDFSTSTPIIGELSRLAWNDFNPDNPLAAVREGTVPATCDPNADPVMSALLSSNLPMIGP